MKDKLVPLLIVLGVSMLCSFTVIIPQNTLTTPLNRFAAPSVCGDRELMIEKDSDVYIQGEQTHLVTAYCVDAASGDKQDVSNELIKAIGRVQVVAIILLGLLLFGLGMMFLRWAAKRLNTSVEDLFKPSTRK